MPRAGLTRARVASVAADVADEVGLERLTLAAASGCRATSRRPTPATSRRSTPACARGRSRAVRPAQNREPDEARYDHRDVGDAGELLEHHEAAREGLDRHDVA